MREPHVDKPKAPKHKFRKMKRRRPPSGKLHEKQALHKVKSNMADIIREVAKGGKD